MRKISTKEFKMLMCDWHVLHYEIFLMNPSNPILFMNKDTRKIHLTTTHLKFWEWYIFFLSPMTKEKLPLSCERSFIYTSLYLPETKVNKNWNSAAIDQAPESADTKNHNLLPVKFSATDVKASKTGGVWNSKKKELANFVPKSFRQNCNLCCLPPCSQHSGLVDIIHTLLAAEFSIAFVQEKKIHQFGSTDRYTLSNCDSDSCIEDCLEEFIVGRIQLRFVHFPHFPKHPSFHSFSWINSLLKSIWYTQSLYNIFFPHRYTCTHKIHLRQETHFGFQYCTLTQMPPLGIPSLIACSMYQEGGATVVLMGPNAVRR